jgi:photosystem II stability/assembly factor-like uncharacterized protein
MGRYALIAALAVLLAGIAAWWIIGQSRSVGARPLYQFQTQDFHSLAFDPVDADTLFFGHHDGLMASQDGGESWQDTSLTGSDAMQLGMPLADPSRRYVAGHDVFLVSSDGGQTWQPQQNNLPDLDLHGFAASPSDPNRLYAIAIGAGSLFTSADGGVTWEARSLPQGMQMGMLPLAVAPDDPLHLFAGVGSEIAESRDGGNSWQTRAGPSGTITTIATAPSTPGILYVGSDTGLWKQSSSGTWERLPITPHGAVLAVAVSATQPEHVAVVDEQGFFFRSVDAGQSWVSAEN